MSNLVTFEDLAKMKREILGSSAPASIVKEVAASTKFRRMFNSDMSLGRALTGPQFIDTVAIEDGAVTAEKLVATLVLSTTIIAGAEAPEDRIVLDATGQAAYATVNGVPNTQYYSLTSAGWSVGSGAQQMSFDNATGTMTVPAAVITSLTIADIGDGQIGGDYYTSATDTGTRLRLTTAGLQMYNGSTQTVNLNAATGAFTLSNDPAGANRITISDTGIELWKASTRQFYLQGGGATNAVTMLLTGPGVSDYIGLNPTDGIWTGASTFAGASTKFRVTPAGVMNATGVTISGAITATSGELQTLSVTGALTISSAGVFRSGPTTGARVEMDSSGLYQYGSSGTGTPRARLLATGAGALGISTSYSSGVVSWTTAGALTLAGFTVTDSLLSSGSGGSFVTMSSGATAFSAGGATPSSAPFRVTNAGALTATTLSAGALTITGAASFSGGTLSLPNGGSISSSAIDINGSGGGSPGTMSNMNLDGVTTIVSGGSIVDGDGSSWSQSGITLVAAGTFGDAITWRVSGTDRGSITANSTGLLLIGHSSLTGAALFLGSNEWRLDGNTSATAGLQSSSGRLETSASFYPGNAGNYQSTRSISDNGTTILVDAPYLRVTGSTAANNPILYLGSAYSVGSTSAWSTNGPGTANITSVSTTYLLISIGGTLYRLPIWANS